jgi:hypothetical protein
MRGALYEKAKGRALDGSSLPESLVGRREKAFANAFAFGGTSLSNTLNTKIYNALTRSGKGIRGNKVPGRFSAEQDRVKARRPGGTSCRAFLRRRTRTWERPRSMIEAYHPEDRAHRDAAWCYR